MTQQVFIRDSDVLSHAARARTDVPSQEQNQEVGWFDELAYI